jgi:hypothetical protein
MSIGLAFHISDTITFHNCCFYGSFPSKFRPMYNSGSTSNGQPVVLGWLHQLI